MGSFLAQMIGKQGLPDNKGNEKTDESLNASTSKFNLRNSLNGNHEFRTSSPNKFSSNVVSPASQN